MLFCGNCGFRLAPGDRQCPRCGTVIDPDLLAAEEDAQPDAPTAASPSLLARMQPPPQATRPPGSPGGDPQKLVLRPGQDMGSYDMQDAGDATRRVDATGYDYGTATQRAPSNPDMRTSYPGYPQTGNNYPPQHAPYPGYPQGGMNDYIQSPPTQFAPPENTGYQPHSGRYQQQANAKGRTAALVIILLGLLLILVAMALFILQRNGVIGASGSGGNTATVTTTSATPEQQAQAFIQQYYDNVNKKDYPAAYNMWKDDPQKPTLANFENGYSNTIHDSVAFANVAAQSDGSVKVPVTVAATEKTATGGTTISTYKGFYIVGQQNNGWKILQGTLNKV